MSYITTVEMDENGEFILVIPDELITELGWAPGDEIEWSEDENKRITLIKIEKNV
jgi:bifunctional DNA-binding transcriptional regulator/antitoxin component of YhaV-PrlF toxin-antitoxin module